MTGIARHRAGWQPWLRPFAGRRGWVAAGLVGIAALLAAWLAWSLLRPNPRGFAPTAGGAEPAEPAPDRPALASAPAPAVMQFTVDARSRKSWVFFDFESGTVVDTKPEGLDWDIAFRRNDILTNGGATNPAGQGGVVDLGEIALAEAAVPAGGYAADEEHDERGLENPAMHNWYRYDWTTHVVSSRNHTYALRTATGEVVFLTFISYYCDDRTAGCMTFRYRWAPPDAGAGGAAPKADFGPEAAAADVAERAR